MRIKKGPDAALRQDEMRWDGMKLAGCGVLLSNGEMDTDTLYSYNTMSVLDRVTCSERMSTELAFGHSIEWLQMSVSGLPNDHGLWCKSCKSWVRHDQLHSNEKGI